MTELSSTALAKKFGLKSNMCVMIANASDDFLVKLGKFPDGVTITNKAEGQVDLVLTFVRSISELNQQSAKSIAAIKYDGKFWFAYPKKSSQVKTDISRDIGWNALTDKGFDTVAAISIDETWSALRFRLKEKIGKK